MRHAPLLVSEPQRAGTRRRGGRTAVAPLAAVILALLLTVTVASTPALAASGAFTGTYAGTYSYAAVGTYTGSGTATLIGPSGFTSKQHCGSGSCLGTATLTSTAHPADSLSVSFWCPKPCPNSKPYHYSVWKGTGAFATATGGGTVVFTLAGTGTFTATFTGTLNF